MKNRNSIIPLSFDQKEIRAIDQDGEPWFVAADVCHALGLTNPRKAVANLDADEKGVTSSDTLGGKQDITILSEAGVYTLALRCRDAMKPGTAPYTFRKWVTGVALPALRRGNNPLELTQDVRQVIGGIVKGIVHKEMGSILPAMIRDEVLSGSYHVVEGVSALEVAEMAGYKTGMRPRGATQFISRRLGRYHEDHAVPIRRSRHGAGKVRLFDEVTARRWLDQGGGTEIDHYIAGKRGQGNLKLVR